MCRPRGKRLISRAADYLACLPRLRLEKQELERVNKSLTLTLASHKAGEVIRRVYQLKKKKKIVND